MPKAIETILTNVGIPADEVAKIVATPDDDATFDAKPYVEKVRTNYKTQLQNDPAFFNDLTLEKLPGDVVKKIESAQFQRSANIMKDKVVKGLGLTTADLADLTDEQKEKLESFVSAVADKYVKTKASDKQVQTELIEARKKLEGFAELETNLKTKYETESDKKVSNAIFNAALMTELGSIPGLKIPASDIAATAKELILQKYGYKLMGDYGIELRNKTNTELKALKDGTSHELTLKDALSEIAVARNWVDKEEEGDGSTGSGKVKVTSTGGKLKMAAAPHFQDKISKKIAAEG